MDAYRDEKETLRRRVSELERELAEARALLAHDDEKERLRERVAELEKHAEADGRAQLIRELDALHEELDRLKTREARGGRLSTLDFSLRVLALLTIAGGLAAVSLESAFWVAMFLVLMGIVMLATRYSSRHARARWARLVEASERTSFDETSSKRRRAPHVRVETEDAESDERLARAELREGEASHGASSASLEPEEAADDDHGEESSRRAGKR